MIVHHVQNDGDASFVARIHERFQIVLRAIGFVHSEIECGVVAPAVVSIEFIDWHQLNRLNTEALEIIQAVFNEFQGAFLGEITHQQFIDHQVFLVRLYEGRVGPIESLFADGEHAHGTCGFDARIRRHLGVRGLWDVLVVELIQDYLRVGVGHTNVVWEDVVLVAVVLTWRQTVQLNPEGFAISYVVHQGLLIECPIVEVSHGKDVVFVGGRPLQNDCAVVYVIDAIFQVEVRRRRGHGR